MSDDHLCLRARDVRFDRSSLPVCWIPGEPVATQLLDVLHLLLPEGERWFVRVFTAALPLVRDGRLAEDVRGFVGQEVVHASSHQGALDQRRPDDAGHAAPARRGGGRATGRRARPVHPPRRALPAPGPGAGDRSAGAAAAAGCRNGHVVPQRSRVRRTGPAAGLPAGLPARAVSRAVAARPLAAPMVRSVAAAGADWRLVHTGRSIGSMPLSGELAALAPARVARHADADRAGPPPVGDLLGDRPPGCAVYCCGPPAMIDAVRAATPAGHRFSPPPIRGGRPFTIGIDGGPDVTVPADRSALDAVREIRADVAWSCRQGFCGTCHVPLLDGATAGDTAVPGRTALCVGRAAGERIVVDLRRGAR